MPALTICYILSFSFAHLQFFQINQSHAIFITMFLYPFRKPAFRKKEDTEPSHTSWKSNHPSPEALHKFFCQSIGSFLYLHSPSTAFLALLSNPTISISVATRFPGCVPHHLPTVVIKQSSIPVTPQISV